MALFIKKYYTNELIRGLIFFIGLGLIYFLLTLFVEHFLWLNPLGRTVLFWCFVAVEVFLFFRFICYPLLRLFKIQKGINFNDASVIIGKHFPEVSDKLTNFLQLSSNSDSSELLLASIDQKASLLQPISFGNAINFGSNKRFLPLAIVPIIVILFFFVSGNSSVLSQSFTRVVNFRERFLPPAPFRFVIENKSLVTEQNKDFTLKVKAVGKILPDKAMIVIGEEFYFMEAKTPGEFQYTFTNPKSAIDFRVEANQLSSPDYRLTVLSVPAIVDFDMILSFPAYLKRSARVIKGNGNAIVPEGTKVSWRINTIATQSVIFKDSIVSHSFSKQDNQFVLTKNVVNSMNYSIVTSNDRVRDYEKLSYTLSVIKDQYPFIDVSNVPDSLKVTKTFVVGQISDDYGLSKLQVVYYPRSRPTEAKRGIIAVKSLLFDRFVFSFPANLPVIQGVDYEYYFEVFDNDLVHNYKSARSSLFSSKISTEEDIRDLLLQDQNESIQGMQKSLNSQSKQFAEMDKLQKLAKEKSNLEFKDRQKVTDFLKKQQMQDEKIRSFADKMKENLDKLHDENKDGVKEDLKEKIENVKKDMEKNADLIKELKELNEKISQEGLMEKMDKFKQISKNQTKTLEQLVELTKKYYVQKKAEQIKDKLENLAEKQEKLGNEDKNNTAEKQDALNREFEKIKEELKDLEMDNKDLDKPLDIPDMKQEQKSIDEEMKDAKEELSKQNKAGAKKQQKSAAKKMKEMMQQMALEMQGGEMEQLQEDVEMLRQVLDNLLAFSFSQEDLMKKFAGYRVGSPAVGKALKAQQDLRAQFKHVDDSLFAMSLRNPIIGDKVYKELGNAHYYLEKSIASFTGGDSSRGVSSQQYVVSSANSLADMLSDILNNMQMSMSGASGSGGSGKPKPGQGQGGQLPDIIKKQQGLGQKMKSGMKSSEKQGGEKGEDGKEGQVGKEGKQGSGSSEGSGSRQGSNGENKNGEDGEDGEGNAKEIMEIYKQQKQLRESLQNELNKKGLGGLGQNAIDQMKQLEKQLLNKGFKNENLHRILAVQQELLKLNNAIQQQGEDKQRSSETNIKEFSNQAKPLPASLLEYLNSIEILNRQSLPLRTNFDKKIKEYFR